MIILQKHLQRLSLELAFTTVNILVDGLERLDIKVDHLLCSSVVHENFSTENDQAVFRCLLVITQLAYS